MSHVVSIDVQITDLDCLKAAAQSCGLELVIGQKQYLWWGHSVGDYPLPVGFCESDLGKCDHALRVKGESPEKGPMSYEIGVVRRKDGKPGYTLLFDFYGQHKLLHLVGGESASKLRQAYSREVAVKQAKKAGFRVIGQSLAKDGSIVLKMGRG